MSASRSVSLCESMICRFSPSLLTPSPGDTIKAGDHHDVGLAEADLTLQPRRHQLKCFQMLQGVHLERLP